jgi:hypothetical protein
VIFSSAALQLAQAELPAAEPPEPAAGGGGGVSRAAGDAGRQKRGELAHFLHDAAGRPQEQLEAAMAEFTTFLEDAKAGLDAGQPLEVHLNLEVIELYIRCEAALLRGEWRTRCAALPVLAPEHASAVANGCASECRAHCRIALGNLTSRAWQCRACRNRTL